MNKGKDGIANRREFRGEEEEQQVGKTVKQIPVSWFLLRSGPNIGTPSEPLAPRDFLPTPILSLA